MSLNDDVARLLEQESRSSGASFEHVVNHFLRMGFIAAKQPLQKPFVVTPRKMGLPPGLNYDNVGDLLEILEDAEQP